MLLLLVVFLAAGCSANNTRIHLVNRIVGGTLVPIAHVPWTVSYGDICGGSILSEIYVITAAHCLYRDFVRIKTSVIPAGELIRVRSYHIHPYYVSGKKDYDFQLLKLERPIVFDLYAQPIQIGDDSMIIPGAMVNVVGWGSTAEDAPMSKFLLSVYLPIVDSTICSIEMTSDITDRMFCAGYEQGGVDSCQGDSGGPVTLGGKLIGVVSFGRGCARPSSPGVYAKVSSVKDWIAFHLYQAAFGLQYYPDEDEVFNSKLLTAAQ